ncbi:uncharacterized protein LDX57_009334 [Aspergillus melleus]|uniref:uncharacterized protein n=1 Tax=Aspergillus melleus TaxID=138277 RepID=UPI001E8EECA4|nr:uncharacterized protein LDX57_009334 [Aspergillus melleus]KAH8431680.1 hypothetical protein LDX57_009334 [Aspergillus melleus]
MLQTQLTTAHEENGRLRHGYALECHRYDAATRELSQLRGQLKRLEAMLSPKERDSESISPFFFHLEAREMALEQAERELSQKAAALSVACQNVAERYSSGRTSWVRPKPGQHMQQHLQQGYCTPIGTRPNMVDANSSVAASLN